MSRTPIDYTKGNWNIRDSDYDMINSSDSHLHLFAPYAVDGKMTREGNCTLAVFAARMYKFILSQENGGSSELEVLKPTLKRLWESGQFQTAEEDAAVAALLGLQTQDSGAVTAKRILDDIEATVKDYTYVSNLDY
jgi:hypothetical protein